MGVSLEVESRSGPEPLAVRVLRDDPPMGEAAADIVFLHGFSQNSGCIGPLPTILDGSIRFRAPDLPGHGRSPAPSSDEGDLWTVAGSIASSMGNATYVGYSMGGRCSLHVALAHPEVVDRLVLIGATAGIADAVQRRRRTAGDLALAERLERIGIDAFTAEWLDQPLFARLPRWARFDAERQLNGTQGLAWSLRHCGTGSMQPLWDQLAGIDCPVLVLAGEFDDRYVALGARMADAIGANAEFAVIGGAGHSVHLEQPEATAESITDFINRTGP